MGSCSVDSPNAQKLNLVDADRTHQNDGTGYNWVRIRIGRVLITMLRRYFSLAGLGTLIGWVAAAIVALAFTPARIDFAQVPFANEYAANASAFQLYDPEIKRIVYIAVALDCTRWMLRHVYWFGPLIGALLCLLTSLSRLKTTASIGSRMLGATYGIAAAACILFILGSIGPLLSEQLWAESDGLHAIQVTSFCGCIMVLLWGILVLPAAGIAGALFGSTNADSE